jgi:hypothetical protein
MFSTWDIELFSDVPSASLKSPNSFESLMFSLW